MHVESGTDSEALGYGPGPEVLLAAGYDSDPVPRPAPAPWTPPTREPGFFLAVSAQGSGGSPERPVPYNEDLERVCKHLTTLEPAASQRRSCRARYRIERVFRTIANWKTLAACIETAADLDAVGACELETPRAFGPNVEYPRESAVCMHIFALAIVKQLGPEPMLNSERLLEFGGHVETCVTELVTGSRADRNPSEYVEMLECIEDSRTVTAADACESL